MLDEIQDGRAPERLRYADRRRIPAAGTQRVSGVRACRCSEAKAKPPRGSHWVVAGFGVAFLSPEPGSPPRFRSGPRVLLQNAKNPEQQVRPNEPKLGVLCYLAEDSLRGLSTSAVVAVLPASITSLVIGMALLMEDVRISSQGFPQVVDHTFLLPERSLGRLVTHLWN